VRRQIPGDLLCMTRASILLGLALCLTHPCGPARAATTTELALSVACCPRAVYLAPHVDRAARRYLLHPVLLVALLRVESHCRMRAVSRKGAVCAMQLLGVARHGHSRRALMHSPALCLETGTRWLSLMIVQCGAVARGLGSYNTGRCDRGRGFARRVLRRERKIWEAVRKRREDRT
jgi:hypothetical protein